MKVTFEIDTSSMSDLLKAKGFLDSIITKELDSALDIDSGFSKTIANKPLSREKNWDAKGDTSSEDNSFSAVSELPQEGGSIVLSISENETTEKAELTDAINSLKSLSAVKDPVNPVVMEVRPFDGKTVVTESTFKKLKIGSEFGDITSDKPIPKPLLEFDGGELILDATPTTTINMYNHILDKKRLSAKYKVQKVEIEEHLKRLGIPIPPPKPLIGIYGESSDSVLVTDYSTMPVDYPTETKQSFINRFLQLQTPEYTEKAITILSKYDKQMLSDLSCKEFDEFRDLVNEMEKEV